MTTEGLWVDNLTTKEVVGLLRALVPKDRTDAEHMAGADVADAKAQAKVDEARARDAARDVAVEQQQQKHREVSDSMQEITDKYDKEKSDRQGGDTEYI